MNIINIYLAPLHSLGPGKLGVHRGAGLGWLGGSAVAEHSVAAGACDRRDAVAVDRAVKHAAAAAAAAAVFGWV